MDDLLIPLNIIIAAKANKVDKSLWFVHCGDHIMARDANNSYIIIAEFNAYDLNALKEHTNIVYIHNTNLALGFSDIYHNDLVAKAFKQKSP